MTEFILVLTFEDIYLTIQCITIDRALVALLIPKSKTKEPRKF